MLSVTLQAHAKVNLALAVAAPLPAGHPRAGMHPIASWMAPLDLADDLTISALPPGSASVFDLAWHADAAPALSSAPAAHSAAHPAPAPLTIDWPLEKDLAFRAHAALSAHVGRPLPVAVTLRKRIPAGGGLGGGSADAAAMLRGLDHLFHLALPEATLHALAAALGSDIPFFIDASRPPAPAPAPTLPPRPALVSGLGERVQRLPARGERVAITLVFPPFGCPTGAVYRAFDDAPPSRFREDEAARLAAAPHPPTDDDVFNDLAPAAERAEPRLAALRRELSGALGRPVHVSGSGSTLFALGHNAPASAGDAAFLRLAAAAGCRVHAAHVVL